MSACSSTNYAKKWQDLSKNSRIEVITTSGEKFQFESWSIGVDSSFIGISDSTARFFPKEAIQGIYVRSSEQEKILSAGFVFGAILLLFLAIDYFMNMPLKFSSR